MRNGTAQALMWASGTHMVNTNEVPSSQLDMDCLWLLDTLAGWTSKWKLFLSLSIKLLCVLRKKTEHTCMFRVHSVPAYAMIVLYCHLIQLNI